MAKIGNVDLGNVELVVPIKTKSQNVVALPGEGGAYPQSMTCYRQTWHIEGHLNNPTQAQREAFLGLENDEVMLVEVPAFSLFGYGKVREIRMWVDNVYPNVYHYDMEVSGCPAIGKTHVQTNDVYLHDLAYRMNLKSFDPHFQRFNMNYSSDRFTVDYQFYLDNDKDSVQDAVIEIECGDDINRFYLYHYNGSGWSVVGTWGTGATAWGGTISFDDAGTIAHNAVVNYGSRGASLEGIGVVSRKLGCKYRVLCLIGSLSAHSAADLTTDYSHDQLLLKVALEHSAAESGPRDYVKMTYVDGSLDHGPA